MSENKAPGEFTSFVPSDEVLQFPDGQTVLREHAKVLTRQPLLSFVERAVMAGIWTLVDEGQISAGELRVLLLRFYGYVIIESEENEEWLEPVRRDLSLAWQQLAKLVAGKRIGDDDGPGATTVGKVRAFERLRDTMYVISVSLERGVTAGADAAMYIPSEAARVLRLQVTRELLGSPYALGASLALLWTYPKEGFYSTDPAHVCLVDGLARAVIAAVADYKDALGSHAKTMALGRIDIPWMILKGCIFGALESAEAGSGRSLPGILVEYPEVVVRIAFALQHGFEALEAAQREADLTVPEWSDSTTPPSAGCPTGELVEWLNTQVAAEARDIDKRRP